jgi:hypothetical protein
MQVNANTKHRRTQPHFHPYTVEEYLEIIALAHYEFVLSRDGYVRLGFTGNDLRWQVFHGTKDPKGLWEFLTNYDCSKTLYFKIEDGDWEHFPFDDFTPPNKLLHLTGLMRWGRKAATEGVDWPHVATMDFRDVLRRCRAPVRKYMGPFTPGRRSEVLYLIANTLREYGATDNEIACVLRKSRAFQSKCEERGARWGEGEIERICAKLRRH